MLWEDCTWKRLNTINKVYEHKKSGIICELQSLHNSTWKHQQIFSNSADMHVHLCTFVRLGNICYCHWFLSPFSNTQDWWFLSPFSNTQDWWFLSPFSNTQDWWFLSPFSNTQDWWFLSPFSNTQDWWLRQCMLPSATVSRTPIGSLEKTSRINLFILSTDGLQVRG